jgi:hypothetical protein
MLLNASGEAFAPDAWLAPTCLRDLLSIRLPYSASGPLLQRAL